MKFLSNIWDWFNGRKTIIGAGLLIAGTVASGGVPFIPAIAAAAPAVPYLLGAGTLLGGTGLAHKALKAVGVADPAPTP